MSVNGIIERIQRDAIAEAEKIKQKKLEEIQQLEREFRAKREEIIDDSEKRAEIERKKSYQRAIDHEHSVQSQKLLSHKQKLINEFYDIVRNHIENLSSDEYREYFAGLLAKLGENEGKIFVNADSDVLNEEFLKIAAGLIKQNSGNEPNFTIGKSEKNFRGFILDCGKIRYDTTLDAVLSIIREKTEEKVIGELFGE